MILMSQAITDKFLQNFDEGFLKSWLESVLPDVLSFFWCVILALLIFYIGGRIIKVVRSTIKKSLERREIEKGVVQFIDGILRIILWAVDILIILQLFGLQTSSITAAVASVGVAAGLALQGSLSNFAGGVLILIFHPFQVGDYIVEDTNKNEGTVAEISIFYTKLKTIDNKIVVVPNGTLANASLTNVTMSDRRQLDLRVSIGYDADIKKAKAILERLILEDDRRLKDHEPKIFVNELGESAVELGLRVWVPTDLYWDIRWELLEKIKLTFDEEGITIPFNQLDVHLTTEDK